MENINRHDLKNPLMVILNIPSLISRQANITADQKKWIAMIEDAAREMLEMINCSIDMCKMDAQCGPTDRRSLCRDCTEKSVTLDLDVHGLPASTADTFIINTEELLFYSMLSNLVRNAVEAAPAGSTVLLSFTDGDARVIAIHNEGVIPEKIRDRFFEKFATAGKPGATGLGAYSARLIAKTLGGTIGFETSEKAGTTITVRLPPSESDRFPPQA